MIILFEIFFQLLDDVVLFDNMNFRSKATVYAIRAAVLIQYSGSDNYFKRACEYAKKACDLDPKTSHWFYIYSLTLTARRHFLYSYKSCPTTDELKTSHEAIMLSDGKNTFYNYHRMTLERDIAIRDYHNNTNKNDKFMIEKNIKNNKLILHMITYVKQNIVCLKEIFFQIIFVHFSSLINAVNIKLQTISIISTFTYLTLFTNFFQ